MIFKKPLDRLVLEGRKTQTRRPVKPGQPCQWKPGHDYAVERPSGTPTDARIEVTAVHQEFLGSIDYHAVRAEGFKTRAQFADFWMCIYDRAWPPVEPCHACDGAGDADCDRCYQRDPATGELVGDHAPGCSKCGACDGSGEQLADVNDDQVLARFEQHHACTLVWVITFRLADVGRYLTPAARPAGTEHGYTRRLRDAMPDEPEVVDPPESALARARAEREERDRQNQAKRVANRLRQESIAAARAGIDTTDHLRRVQDILAELDALRRAV